MITTRSLLLFVLFPSLTYGAVPLEDRLLHPTDLPASCHETSGLFPTNAKVDLFYQYKVYQAVVPPVADRHAQSFECSGVQGTLYFLEYESSGRAQDALLFANPVLTQTAPAPVLREWKTGFVIVSFVSPPPELMTALDQKLGDPVATTSSPVLPVAAATDAVSAPTPTSPMPSVDTTATAPIPEPAVTPSPPTPVAAPVMPSTAKPVSGPFPDVSDAVLKTVLTRAECKDQDGSGEVKDFCTMVNDFRRGTTLDVLINNPKEPLVGPYYVLGFDGSLEGPRYEALLGSGKVWEITMVPLLATTGVDDFEIQALIDSRKKHDPWPTNDMSTAIAAYALPSHPTSTSTDGKSQVLPQKENHYLFFRRSGHEWIYLSVYGVTAAEQLRSEISVGRLY